MDIFQTLGSGSLSVTAMLDFSGKANTSIHGLGEDDTAIPHHYIMTFYQSHLRMYISAQNVSSIHITQYYLHYHFQT